MAFNADNLKTEFVEGKIDRTGKRINRHRVVYLADSEAIDGQHIQKAAIDRVLTAEEVKQQMDRLAESLSVFTGIYSALLAKDAELNGQ